MAGSSKSALAGAAEIEAVPRVGIFRTERVVLGLAVLLLLLLVGYPVFWLSFGAIGLPEHLTFEHLQRVFTRSQNYTALANTVVLALGAGLMSLVFGVPLAWAVARTTMPARRVVHGLVALAYITPPYLTSLAYIILLG